MQHPQPLAPHCPQCLQPDATPTTSPPCLPPLSSHQLSLPNQRLLRSRIPQQGNQNNPWTITRTEVRSQVVLAPVAVALPSRRPPFLYSNPTNAAGAPSFCRSQRAQRKASGSPTFNPPGESPLNVHYTQPQPQSQSPQYHGLRRPREEPQTDPSHPTNEEGQERETKRQRMCVVTTTTTDVRCNYIIYSPTSASTYSTTTTTTTISSTLSLAGATSASNAQGFPTSSLSSLLPAQPSSLQDSTSPFPFQQQQLPSPPPPQFQPGVFPPQIEETFRRMHTMAFGNHSSGMAATGHPPFHFGVPFAQMPEGTHSRTRTVVDFHEDAEDDEDEDSDDGSDDEYSDSDDEYSDEEEEEEEVVLDEDTLSFFPRFTYRKEDADRALIKEPLCVICQEDYKEGDTLLTLACVHNFHAACIGKWLACKPECPLCKEQVPAVTRRRMQASLSPNQNQI